MKLPRRKLLGEGRRRAPALRRAFTLVETLIAVGLGAVVLGGGLYLFAFGNRAFYKTSEHVSFRGEAMLIIERFARDMEQLMVSPTMRNPLSPSAEPSILAPYVITQGGQASTQKMLIPNPEDPDGQQIEVAAGNGITFFKYHHTEMIDTDPARLAQLAPADQVVYARTPTLVGQVVSWEAKEIQSGEHAGKGLFDLYRNGEKVNRAPLSDVIFHKEPQLVVANQVKGSPHAIVTLKVVPQMMTGAAFNSHRDPEGRVLQTVLAKLGEKQGLVQRTFHLSGYESMYTNLLYRALSRVRAVKNRKENGVAVNENKSFDELFKLALETPAEEEVNDPDALAAIENATSNFVPTPDLYIPPKNLLYFVAKDAYYPEEGGQASAAIPEIDKLANKVENGSTPVQTFPRSAFFLQNVELDEASEGQDLALGTLTEIDVAGTGSEAGGGSTVNSSNNGGGGGGGGAGSRTAAGSGAGSQ